MLLSILFSIFFKYNRIYQVLFYNGPMSPKAIQFVPHGKLQNGTYWKYPISKSLVLLWIWQKNQPLCPANQRSYLKIHTILKTDVLCYYAHCMLKITKWSQSTPKFFFVISFTLHKLYAGFMCLCCKLLLLLVSFKTYTNFQYFSNTEICLLHSKIIWKAGLSTWSKKSFTNCADQLNVNKMIKISVDPNTSVKIRFLLLFLPFFPRDVLTMPSFFFLLCFYTRPV